jgi:hypothetical protein
MAANKMWELIFTWLDVPDYSGDGGKKIGFPLSV